MKLADWARRQGVSYTTAWRWTKDDAMPVPWRKTDIPNYGNVLEYFAGSSSSSSPSVTIPNVPLPQGVFAVPGPHTP